MTNFTSFNKKTLKSWLIPTILIKKMQKLKEICVYLPIQKSLKILPNMASTSTFPTILPKPTCASLRSSALVKI